MILISMASLPPLLLLLGALPQRHPFAVRIVDDTRIVDPMRLADGQVERRLGCGLGLWRLAVNADTAPAMFTLPYLLRLLGGAFDGGDSFLMRVGSEPLNAEAFFRLPHAPLQSLERFVDRVPNRITISND